jgi:hypothetical protein
MGHKSCPDFPHAFPTNCSGRCPRPHQQMGVGAARYGPPALIDSYCSLTQRADEFGSFDMGGLLLILLANPGTCVRRTFSLSESSWRSAETMSAKNRQPLDSVPNRPKCADKLFKATTFASPLTGLIAGRNYPKHDPYVRLILEQTYPTECPLQEEYERLQLNPSEAT